MSWASQGTLGSAVSLTANQATISLTLATAVPSGRFVAVFIACDNQNVIVAGSNTSTDILSVTDSQGNQYVRLASATQDSGVAQDGISVALFGARISTALSSGDTITATTAVAASCDASAIQAWQFSMGAGSHFQIENRAISQGSGIGATLSLTLPDNEYLLLKAQAIEGPNADVYTEDTDYTTIGGQGTTSGTAAANACIRGGYRIATLTSDTNTGSNSTNRDNALALVALKEIPSGTPLSMFGNYGPVRDPRGIGKQRGTAFKVAFKGKILGVRHYRSASDTEEAHVGRIWVQSTQSNVAACTFSGQTSSGWQYQALPTPLDIAADTVYVVTVYADVSTGVEEGKQFYSSCGNSMVRAPAYTETPNGYASTVAHSAVFPAEDAEHDGFLVDILFLPDSYLEPPFLQLGPPVFYPAALQYWTLSNTIATTQNKTANSTSIVATTTDTAAVGDLIVVLVSKDNSTTPTNSDNSEITGVTNSSGNTFTKLRENTFGGATQSGVTISMWITQCVNPVAIGATITATLGGTTAANDSQAMSATVIKVPSGRRYTVFSSTAVVGTGTTYPTITLSSLPSGQDLLILGATGREGTFANTHTEDTDYTTFGANGTTGTAATCTSMHGHFRAFQGTTDTIGGTISTTSQDIARVMVCLVPLWWPETLVLSPQFYTPTFSNDTGSTYTLTADAAAFAEAGQDASLLRARLFDAQAGAVALAGQDAALKAGWSLASDAATYLCVGFDADVRRSRIFISDAGAFSLAGQPAGVLYSRIFTTDAGSYALAGQIATFNQGYSLISDAGAIALAGQTATFVYGRAVQADAGAFGLAGQQANALYGRLSTADAGSYALAGAVANFAKGYGLTADAGALTLGGVAALVVVARQVAGAAGAVALGGQVASLLRGYALASDFAAFSLSGQAAGLLRGLRGQSDVGTFVLAGQSAGTLSGRSLAGDARAFALAGQDAGLVYQPVGAYVLDAAAVSLSLNGQAAGLLSGIRMQADSAAYTLSGAAAGAVKTYSLVSNTGAFAFAGQDAGFLYGRRIIADAAGYALAGQQAGAFYGRRLTSDTGAVSLTGQVASVRKGYSLTFDAGAFSLTGQAAGYALARRITADARGFILAGQDASLIKQTAGAFSLDALQGSFTLSGQTANFLHSYVFAGGAGAYLTGGQSATLTVGRIFAADAGAFALDGQPAGLLKTTVFKVDAQAGAFALAGQAVGIALTRILVADDGIFTWVGEELPFFIPAKTPERIYIIQPEDRTYYVQADPDIEPPSGVDGEEAREYVVALTERIYTVEADQDYP